MGTRVALCLHGFLRTGLSMARIRQRLSRFEWTRTEAPTWRYELQSLDALGRRAADRICELGERSASGTVDVVTHSMGGLVLRAALAHTPPIRRVVMIAPPNQGAEMARIVRRVAAVHQLGWDPLAPLLPGAPGTLPTAAGFEVGVIAGGRGTLRGFNPLLGADNDGTVRTDETHLRDATEHLVLPVHHSFATFSPSVIAATIAFLRDGRFTTS